MKLPGPDHPITIAASRRRVRVLFEHHLIADTAGALILKEASYKPAFYFPREDVAMAYLSRTAHVTHCPYKGEASYFTIVRDGEIRENAVWSYEDPYPAMSAIRGLLAFYPNQVEIEEYAELMGEAEMRDIVEHTDSGAGSSQLAHWPPNVSAPPHADSPAVSQPYKDTGAI